MNSQEINEQSAICAVLVTHQPDDDLFNNINALKTQVGHIALVDTGSSDEIKIKLQSLEGNVSFHSCPDNNLAKAQNTGIAYARAQGYRFVLLMDDDSTPAPDMTAQLLTAYHHQPDKPRIGLLAPAMTDACSNRQPRYPVPWLKIGFCSKHTSAPLIRGSFTLIASGSLIPLAVLDAVGGMDESYVIDYIDREFCLRLLRNGYDTVVVRAATLRHHIGKACDHTLLGTTITSTNHAPIRRYYIYRNRLRTMAKHGFAVPAFLTYDILAMGYDLLRIIAFEADKKAKLYAILSGIRSALTGAPPRPL